ncbi:hypothetical protein GF340_01070, partial [Candidatus Peregrinibacteria bacterium]|nr:hypothetical protein [Candidatus Peregrinibacteria bacterium]
MTGPQIPSKDKEKIENKKAIEVEQEKKEDLRNIEQIAQKKVEAKGESIKKRTEVKLELFENEEILKPDEETADKIAAIDPEKQLSEEELTVNAETLGAISVTILSKIFKSGIEVNKADTIEEFKSLLNDIDTNPNHKNLKQSIGSSTEKATLKKLLDTLNKPDSPLYKTLEKEWPIYISQTKNLYLDIIKEKGSKVIEWVKKNPAAIAVTILGSIAVYDIFFSKRK